MTSTDVNLGLNGSFRPSSRVLKPPGGGHSTIFGDDEVKPNPPRPKYDQQNSSNLNFVMNTVDPNEAVQKSREEFEKTKQSEISKPKSEASESSSGAQNDQQNSGQGGRVRVPPGGFSSGLW